MGCSSLVESSFVMVIGFGMLFFQAGFRTLEVFSWVGLRFHWEINDLPRISSLVGNIFQH